MLEIASHSMPYDPPAVNRQQGGLARGIHGHRRSASAYLVVLASAVLVTVIGISACLLQRVQLHGAQAGMARETARVLARSAVEIGLLRVETKSDWRTLYGNGFWVTDQPLGAGILSLEAVDPSDGDITDSESDSVLLIGTGVVGEARHCAQVMLTEVIEPLAALRTSLHASGDISVKAADSIRVTGAPLSGNLTISNDGTIYGDVEAVQVTSKGTITGSITQNAASKDLPPTSLFDDYVAKATVLPSTDVIENEAFGPGRNPWGMVNADGVYYMNTAGRDVTIRGVRIYGTLIIDCGNKHVRLEEADFLQNYRLTYPALIVRGNLELKCRSDSYSLSEASYATNFNPSGVAYDGLTDGDTLDDYPNEVRGLIHVIGTLKMMESARVRGLIICDGTVSIEGANEIVHDPTIAEDPPEGYETTRMIEQPGSWRQVVD